MVYRYTNNYQSVRSLPSTNPPPSVYRFTTRPTTDIGSVFPQPLTASTDTFFLELSMLVLDISMDSNAKSGIVTGNSYFKPSNVKPAIQTYILLGLRTAQYLMAKPQFTFDTISDYSKCIFWEYEALQTRDCWPNSRSPNSYLWTRQAHLVKKCLSQKMTLNRVFGEVLRWYSQVPPRNLDLHWNSMEREPLLVGLEEPRSI